MNSAVQDTSHCPLVKHCTQLVHSEVATAGMPIIEAVQHCLNAGLPGIPFCDAQGKVTGKISLKHLLVSTCVPKDISNYAHLISDNAVSMSTGNALEKLTPLMQAPVEDFVLTDFVYAASDTPLYKALALMDKYNTGYFFVLKEGRYMGSLTMHLLSQHMLDMFRAYTKTG